MPELTSSGGWQQGRPVGYTLIELGRYVGMDGRGSRQTTNLTSLIYLAHYFINFLTVLGKGFLPYLVISPSQLTVQRPRVESVHCRVATVRPSICTLVNSRVGVEAY